jgi:hypothetical protein
MRVFRLNKSLVCSCPHVRRCSPHRQVVREDGSGSVSAHISLGKPFTGNTIYPITVGNAPVHDPASIASRQCCSAFLSKSKKDDLFIYILSLY